MKIVVLTGGVGGAKFLLGVKQHVGWDPCGPASDENNEITAIVNTADDIRLHGLQICPDLDSCLYTLSGQADTERGWGRKAETWTVGQELAGYDAQASWFSLGDKDIATHLMRTQMLNAGYRLTDVTAALAQRWQPGVRLLPMTDDRVETHVVIHRPDEGLDSTKSVAASAQSDQAEVGDLVALHFQEWWVRYRARPLPLSIRPVGADEATASAEVLNAIASAELILIAPSNPVVSIGTILAVPGIRQALVQAPAPVVGVSPLIGGAPVRGYADQCLTAIGVPSTAQGVGRHYGARSDGGILDGFLIADGEDADIPGVRVATAPILMTDPFATAAMVDACRRMANV